MERSAHVQVAKNELESKTSLKKKKILDLHIVKKKTQQCFKMYFYKEKRLPKKFHICVVVSNASDKFYIR